MSQAACDTMREDLVAYEDGELPAAERARIAAHLGTCLSCRREVDRIGKLGALIDSLAPIEPASDLADRTWQRLARETGARSVARRERATYYWAVPLAAAAALALGWYWMLAPGGSHEGTRTASPTEQQIAVAPMPPALHPEGDAERRHAPAEAPQLATAPSGAPTEMAPEDLPPELLARPELFLRLPVVRHLDELEHFEAVRVPADQEPIGRRPGATTRVRLG